MKNKLWILLKAQFINQSSLNILRHEKDRKKRKKAIGVGFAMGLVFLMLIGYSFGMSYAFGYLGMPQVVPGIAMTVCSVIVLIFTFAKTNGYIFAFKDYDMLMSLPFKVRTIIAVKFIYMYIYNLVFTLLVMLSMGVGYFLWVKPSFITILIWLLISLFVPLIPMCIAAILGAAAAAIGSKFRLKTLAQIIVSLAAILLIFAINFNLNGSQDTKQLLNSIKNIGNILSEKIHSFYPVSSLFDNAVNNGNIFYFLLFILASIVIYIAFLAIVSFRYRQVNTALMSTSSKKNYKYGEMTQHSILNAFVRKELKRFFSSVPYLMNVGIGAILALIGSVIALFMGEDKVMSVLGFEGINNIIVYAVPFIIAVIITMSCTTGVSLSLEGKNYWILQSLPLKKSTIYKGKMLFNLVLIAPLAVICVFCIGLTLKVSPATFAIYILCILSSVAFSTTFGMWIGCKFSNFEWTNEIEVIKQGSASMLSIFGNMILEIAVTAGVIALSFVINGYLAMICGAVLLSAMAFTFYKIVIKD